MRYGDDSMKTKLFVEGMHCDGCAHSIEIVLKMKKGVNSVRADYKNKNAEIEFNDAEINLEELKEEIRKLGFRTS